MAGYHRQADGSSNLRNLVEIQDPSEQMDALNLDDPNLREDTPETSEKRLRDNMGLGEVLDIERNDELVRFAQDLLLSAGALTAEDTLDLGGSSKRSESEVVQEIKRRLSFPDNSGKEEEADGVGDLPEKSRSGPSAGFHRGASEPPASASGHGRNASEYTWEWGGFPQKASGEEPGDTLHHDRVGSMIETESPGILERPSISATHSKAASSVSLPIVPKAQGLPSNPSTKHLPKHTAERQQSTPAFGLRDGLSRSTEGHPGGLLKNDESDAYKFILETNENSHIFELGLGGDILAGDEVEDNLDEVNNILTCHLFPSNTDETLCYQILLDVFEVNRITFKRFVEDPKIVDQSDLVIRYDSK
jgi:hypothetical protein